MTQEDEKKYIEYAITERIDLLKAQWAKNWLARYANQLILDTPTNSASQIATAQKEVDAANLNMDLAVQQIGIFNSIKL